MIRTELVSQMVASLRSLDVDLGDERDVMRALTNAGFASGDIIACIDEAIETTHRAGLKRSWA